MEKVEELEDYFPCDVCGRPSVYRITPLGSKQEIDPLTYADKQHLSVLLQEQAGISFIVRKL
jgi:hypothetical protein